MSQWVWPNTLTCMLDLQPTVQPVKPLTKQKWCNSGPFHPSSPIMSQLLLTGLLRLEKQERMNTDKKKKALKPGEVTPGRF